jgi:uncharacterized cupredoxin-like copper-binding protein
MRLSRLAIIPIGSLLLAACSLGGGTTSAAPSGTGVASSSPSVSAVAEARVEVELSDDFRIQPVEMTVPMGVPVTFVVTNAGSLDHEFYLGDEAAQDEHEQEMIEMGGMTHDEPEGIALRPGETKELTYTFTGPGQMLAGCHVAGHYGAGMKAEIEVGS